MRINVEAQIKKQSIYLDVDVGGILPFDNWFNNKYITSFVMGQTRPLLIYFCSFHMTNMHKFDFKC